MTRTAFNRKPHIGAKNQIRRRRSTKSSVSPWARKKKPPVSTNPTSGQIVYNYFRYYDPNLGRFITSDPIGISGGTNTYGYVEQNPIRYTDRLGLHHDGQGCVDAQGNRVECPRDVCATANCAAGLPEFEPLVPEPLTPEEQCVLACSASVGISCGVILRGGLTPANLAAYAICRASITKTCKDKCEKEEGDCEE